MQKIPRSRKKVLRIAVFLNISLGPIRRFIIGLHQIAAAEFRPWQIFFNEGRVGERQLTNLAVWKCDAIITHGCDRATAKRFLALNIPILTVDPPPEVLNDPTHPLHGCSRTRTDSAAIGRLAAEYLHGKGFRNFAFVSDERNMYWSRERGDEFERTLAARGCTVERYRWHRHRGWDLGREMLAMQRWLMDLPKPVAVFGSMDGCARLVVDACLMGGIRVPEEVAVLGCDNDEFICNSTIPALSSISTKKPLSFTRSVVAHLDRLIDEPDLPKREFSLPTPQVVTRLSTDITVIASPAVRRAVECIAAEACTPGFNVRKVVEVMRMSRCTAVIAFRQMLKRTILEEITARRLERASELLRDTTLSIAEITARCGYTRQNYLARLFRAHYHQTMSAFRKSC